MYVWWYIRRSYGPLKENGNISKRGYMMAHFSKFVRPGAVRIDATKTPETDVYVSAYKSSGADSLIIVAVNKKTSAVSQVFNISNGTVSKMESWRTSGSENMAKQSDINITSGSFTASLPAQSVTTFVGIIQNGSSSSSSASSSSSSSGALPTCTNLPATGTVGVEIEAPLTMCGETDIYNSRTWQVKNVATGVEETVAYDRFWPTIGNTLGEYEISVTVTWSGGCTNQKALCGTITISADQSSSSSTTPSSSSEETPSSSSEESTPILAQPPVRALRATPPPPQQYYNLKGEPLGAAKPSKPGVYIEKNGKQARKIVVK